MTAIPMKTLIKPCVDFMSERYRLTGGASVYALMAAIGLQESQFEARDQLEMQGTRLVPGRPGPAMGFWQFELGGGVAGVMAHPASRDIARQMVESTGIAFDRRTIWLHLGTVEGDELAAAFARLLLLTDPQPIPSAVPENEQVAWQYYLRNWRPGKPHPQFWSRNWRLACEAALEPGVPNVATPSPPIASVVPPAPSTEDLFRQLDAIVTRLKLRLK